MGYKLNGKDLYGLGIPTGGSTGDVLVKKSATDCDAEWSDVLNDKCENSNVAYIEDGNTATKTNGYAKGDYMVWKGEFRKVTSSIAEGATITNSNTSAVTVGDEFKSLNQSLDGFKIKEATQSGTANPSDFDDYCITIGVSGGSSTYPLTYGMVLTVKRTRTFQINLNANRAMYRFASADSGGWSNWREFTTTVPSI